MRLPKVYGDMIRIPIKDIQYMYNNYIDVSSVERGVFFFIARWSGNSQVSFRSLNRVFESCWCPGLKLYLADIDEEYVHGLMNSINVASTGGGETVWLRSGRVVGRMANYTDDDADEIRRFMAAVCAASVD